MLSLVTGFWVGVGYFANMSEIEHKRVNMLCSGMSVIEHKRVTCFALCFCGLSCHGVSGGWGVGYCANMSEIEHKHVTCCALCFCVLSCHEVSGGGVYIHTGTIDVERT